MRGYKDLFFLPLFFSANWLFAQLSFTIKIQDREIGKADVLQVEYAVDNAGSISDFKQPVFTDWNVVSGPEYSQQSISMNGKTESTISYVYMLSPKKTGSLTVPGSTVTANGKKLACNTASVQVSTQQHVASAQQQQNIFQFPVVPDNMLQGDDLSQNNILKPGENPSEKIRKNIFVKVVASKTTCFVGEPVLVTYQLFSAMQAQAKMNKSPSFSRCSVIEMTSPDEHENIQNINGKDYKVYTIRKVQIIPLQEGDLKLDTASIDNEVTFSSPDNPYKTQNYTATTVSNSLIIHVMPLPEKNKPADFQGAIGTFHITAKADSSRIALGENNNLQIIIEGEGNFNGVSQPAVQWPKDLQHFDVSDSEHVAKTSFPMTGSRNFNIPFIGTKEGTDTIPAISFTFFDPSIQTYQIIHSKDIVVTITPPLPKSKQFKDIVTEDIANPQYLWLGGLIALIVGFVFIITNKKNTRIQDVSLEKNEEIINLEKVKLTEAPKVKTDLVWELNKLQNITDNKEFFMKVKSILNLALQQKLNVSSGTSAILLSALQKQIKNEALRNDAENIYTICDRSLYSPIVSGEEKISLHNQLESVIKRLEV